MKSKWRFLKREPNPSAFTLPIWCMASVGSWLLIFHDGLLVQSSRFPDNQCCVMSHNSKGLKHITAEDCNLTTQPSEENCKYKSLMSVILPAYIITCYRVPAFYVKMMSVALTADDCDVSSSDSR